VRPATVLLTLASFCAIDPALAGAASPLDMRPVGPRWSPRTGGGHSRNPCA